jgi:DNA-binding Lrp family transcriptional regulator
MPVRAYILIKCSAGTAGGVHKGLKRLAIADAKILSADTIVGPFDVIALLESENVDRLGHAVNDGIHRLHGVERTATCVIADL